MKKVVLLSGGLDSAANLALIAARLPEVQFQTVTIHYGQRAALQEIKAARKFSEYYGAEHQIIELNWLKDLGQSALTVTGIAMPKVRPEDLDQVEITRESAKNVWVPNRNGVFIQVAAAIAESAGADAVVVGFNAEEAMTFPDNTPEFIAKSNEALKYSTQNKVRVECDTVSMNKSQIVGALKGLSKPFPFEWIWSCYEGGERPCGRCESCMRLRRVL